LYTKNGNEIIDAISSWWSKSLGHGHPRLKNAAMKQMNKFEHIIGANTCNDILSELSARLANISPVLDKVFYADNGSTAVEIAIKLSLQFHAQTGNSEKKEFVSLKNGYHGETILTLAAGDCELYSKPYNHIMPKITKLSGIPYISGQTDSLWNEMSDENWLLIEKQLNKFSSNLSGIIFEPIVQGAGGMKIYSPGLLKRLRKWADKHKVHLIADEIMTGFGRTGKILACEHAKIIPDFICLSKGLTSGFVPMSAVLCSTEIYNAFYDDYHTGKAFLHSNTYTGYAVGAAVALETLKIYEDEKIIENVQRRSGELRKRMELIQNDTNALVNLRSIGFIVAADIVNPETQQPFNSKLRFGYQCFQNAVKNGALLRHLGDTMYFFPPLNIDDVTLDKLAEIANKSLKQTLRTLR
jgi:adenosylmethionine-8-amino-7-oxononanoate aminotransferase